jgi:hypothetical protein
MNVSLQGLIGILLKTNVVLNVVNPDACAEVPFWIFILKARYLSIFRGFPPALQENVCVLCRAGPSRFLPVRYADRSFLFKDMSSAVE